MAVRSATLRSGQSSVLQGMLRNSPRTTMAAATGALSSATANGFLQRYSGAAAASLAPSMASLVLSSASNSTVGNKGGQDLDASLRNENLAPSNLSSPRSALSTINFLQMVRRQNKPAVEHGFNPNTTGIGPVYGGADW